MTEWLHFHFSLSCIGEGNGNPLQCSCLENPRDGGAWWAAVYGVAQSRTRLKWLSSSSRSMDVRVGLWRKLSTEELTLLNCGVGEDSWESLGLQGETTSPFWRRSALGVLWKKRSTLATSCEELTHWKRLMLGGIGGRRKRGQQKMRWLDGITDSMDVSLSESGSWWWTGRPGVQQFMGSQTVRHDWATELNCCC